MSRLYIQRNEKGLELAVTREGALVYYALDGGANAVAAEQVYLGVADRVMPGMEAVFVRLDGKNMGFLPFSESRDKRRSGDKVLVQVKRPPLGNKSAYLTEDISLAGKYAILLPKSAQRSISSRVTDEQAREAMRRILQRLAPNDMGLVLRAEALSADEDTVAEEIAALQRRWRDIISRVETTAAPALVEGELSPLERILRDERDLTQVLTNSPDDCRNVGLPIAESAAPFDVENVRDQLEKSLRRNVWLSCGGYLTVDICEAMTVIDVNSGKFLGGKKGAQEMILRLNREAAREIARILRLRNLSGIIIIDFVDMDCEENRRQVTKALEDALERDPVKTVLHGFTALGLMEMTRRKAGAPLKTDGKDTP